MTETQEMVDQMSPPKPKRKMAILQVADTGPLESLVMMLHTAGYDCYCPNTALRNELRKIGCDTVIDIDWLVREWGYDNPFGGNINWAYKPAMEQADLYVDVKAHRNYDKVVRRWPNLAGKVLWYRINGGKPEHVIRADGFDCGDEVNPPCPVLTPNLWYKPLKWCRDCGEVGDATACDFTGLCSNGHDNWEHVTPHAYACWPPFRRQYMYYDTLGRVESNYGPPVCLIHNLENWGYRALVDNIRKLGVKCYGRGSPDGLIEHRDIPELLSKSMAMVHLKSSDAPGYALYEGLSAACPLVVSRRLIWRNRMEGMFIPDKTCLVFDRETHDELSPADVERCTDEIETALQKLRQPEYNHQIGFNGNERFCKLTWQAWRPYDVKSLSLFMERHFP